MAVDIAESSSTPLKNDEDKPVIVRVKRKSFQSPVQAFWLEINERPLKRPLLDFHKLSLSDSSPNLAELKTKKIFVQHLDTIGSSKVTADALQSLVAANHVDASQSKAKSEDGSRCFKTKNKQDQLLVKAKQKQEVLSKNARFEQIWKRRKGKKDEHCDEAIHDMCHFYDVIRVDVEDTTKEMQEQDVRDTDLEDYRLMSSYLPLLREFIPSAASEIESDINDYVSRHKLAFEDDYVYDLYAVKEDISLPKEDASNPFPLVQVGDDDGFYDGPSNSENESDDSNAEDNPMNEYPDEEPSEDENDVESRSSDDKSEELEDEFYSDEDGKVYD